MELSLLDELANGQIDAYDALYHRYRQPVYANILKLVWQTETAEDILQEVFVALWENRQKTHLNKSVGGWLFVVSHKKAALYLKKKVRESAVVQWQDNLPDAPTTEDYTSDDLLSVEEGKPEVGWGWLIAHGATMIQTDHPRELIAYLRKRKLHK